jgi:hypothetical protein
VTTRLLPTIETYHDAAPRPVVTIERVGFVRVGTACLAEPS